MLFINGVSCLGTKGSGGRGKEGAEKEDDEGLVQGYLSGSEEVEADLFTTPSVDTVCGHEKLSHPAKVKMMQGLSSVSVLYFL